MEWKSRRRSSNVEDRRGQRRSSGRGKKISGGSLLLALIAIFIFNQDPLSVLQDIHAPNSPQAPVEEGHYQVTVAEQEVADFVSVTLADTEDTWGQIFAQAGSQYPPPKLVLYSAMTPTACGTGQAASGPFYCPGDQKIYLDLSFLNELQRMGAKGDFAVAYVLAHEVGHHIQTITGTSKKVRHLQRRVSKAEGNALQVRMELQADCLAGVWANHTQQRTQFLQEGDLEEALNAAAAVGDDKIMRDAGRVPRREAFTHGSSEQRMEWVRRGLNNGDLRDCDTGI